MGDQIICTVLAAETLKNTNKDYYNILKSEDASHVVCIQGISAALHDDIQENLLGEETITRKLGQFYEQNRTIYPVRQHNLDPKNFENTTMWKQIDNNHILYIFVKSKDVLNLLADTIHHYALQTQTPEKNRSNFFTKDNSTDATTALNTEKIELSNKVHAAVTQLFWEQNRSSYTGYK